MHKFLGHFCWDCFQVIEYALSLLPYESVTIQTPQGVPYDGKCCSAKKICGVSILRAGETMEAALTEVCKDIRLERKSKIKMIFIIFRTFF